MSQKILEDPGLCAAFDRNAEKFDRIWEDFIAFCHDTLWRKRIDNQPPSDQIELLIQAIDAATKVGVVDALKKRAEFEKSQTRWKRPVFIPT